MATTNPVPSLAPYVPRVVREWLDDDPDALHRGIEGSIVFVDISGFTRMSERLARFAHHLPALKQRLGVVRAYTSPRS